MRVIKLIQLTRLIDTVLGGTYHLGNVASRTNFVNERADIFHLGLIVAQRGGARPDGLQNSHPAARILLFLIYYISKGLESKHHPVVGILRQAAHDITGCVHMSVNKAGQNHVVIQSNGFLRGILRQNLGLVTHLQDFSTIHRHSSGTPVTYALPFHGIEMGGNHNGINLFHHNPPSFFSGC